MIIVPELKKIAGMNEKIKRLSERLAEEYDIDGLEWERAYLVSGCRVKGNSLYNSDGQRLNNSGLVDDLYFCNQYTGYCGDDFYGTLYFKTNVPGQFVAVPFAC